MVLGMGLFTQSVTDRRGWDERQGACWQLRKTWLFPLVGNGSLAVSIQSSASAKAKCLTLPHLLRSIEFLGAKRGRHSDFGYRFCKSCQTSHKTTNQVAVTKQVELCASVLRSKNRPSIVRAAKSIFSLVFRVDARSRARGNSMKVPRSFTFLVATSGKCSV
jgi:hypothetical protein